MNEEEDNVRSAYLTVQDEAMLQEISIAANVSASETVFSEQPRKPSVLSNDGAFGGAQHGNKPIKKVGLQ